MNSEHSRLFCNLFLCVLARILISTKYLIGNNFDSSVIEIKKH